MRLLYSSVGRVGFLFLGIFFFGTLSAEGSFHLMQIEQIIGGVNGDTTAQAIQLRMRSSGQNFVSNASVRVLNASGAGELILQNMTTNVTNGAAGSRVLLTTPNFANYTDIPLVSDFIMDPIPASYLPAGQVRFATSNGTTAYWRLSWGGSGFTGSTGSFTTTNDADGDFGPPVNIALPSTTLQALRFTGPHTALSTTNLADYALTSGAATFINNAGTSFTLVAPEPDSADFDDDGDVDGRDFLIWQRGDSPRPFSAEDLALWQSQYDTVPPLSSAVAIPEPLSIALVSGALCFHLLHGRRRS